MGDPGRTVPALVLTALVVGGCLARNGDAEAGAPTVVATTPPVAASPETVLEESGVRDAQRALRDRGFAVPLTGQLDRRTREALLRFQRREGLAPTSMPDMETLQHLGVDAKELYRDL